MILADCVNVCNDIELLNVLSIFKSLIGLVTIIVPVILVIFVIIDIIKTISSGDIDTKKLSKSIFKRVIAAVAVFLVFPILNTVLRILPISNLYYISCYNCASSSNVLEISKNNADTAIASLSQAISTLRSNPNQTNYDNAYRLYEEARLSVKDITDKDTRESYETTLESYKNTLEDIRADLKSDGTISNNTPPSSSNPSGGVVATANLFVGDSRTVSLCSNKSLCTTSSDGTTCYSDECIAKVGAGLSWYNNTAIDKVNDVINDGNKYNIIINMGVNDVGRDGSSVAQSYYDKFSSYANSTWKNHNIIIVSVNPVTDGKSNAYTSGVTSFNQKMSSLIASSNLSNLSYCDTYNNLNITPSSDGLHYSASTSNSIYNYIINNCI